MLADTTDWQSWMEQIELHGLSGFASQHVAAYNLPVPAQQQLALKALNIRHRAASNARHKALSEIATAFAASSLDWVALKGVALMPYIYKKGELRPMRDIDILMPIAQLPEARSVMISLGYSLPQEQPSKFMRDMHQLPNAAKMVDGFMVSVELHNDGISREVPGHYFYPQDPAQHQTIDWDGLPVNALTDLDFAHQVSKHLEGLHSEAVLKLINVMDVIGLANQIAANGKFEDLVKRYPHLLSTLKCLHLYTPLPHSLQAHINNMPVKPIQGTGQIMVSLRTALLANYSLPQRFGLLLRPSDWWLHLYYNVDPNHSLLWVKWVKHPLRILNWLSRRVYSRILGG